MTYVYSLDIPIYESMLCLAYSKTAERLSQTFDDLTLEDEWLEIGEYRRLLAFLQEKRTDEETAETMLRQLRSKQLCHGPTLRFHIPPSGDRPAVHGWFNRWSITFKSAHALPPLMDSAIMRFLSSFGIGTVECDVQDEPDTPTP